MQPVEVHLAGLAPPSTADPSLLAERTIDGERLAFGPRPRDPILISTDDRDHPPVACLESNWLARWEPADQQCSEGDPVRPSLDLARHAEAVARLDVEHDVDRPAKRGENPHDPPAVHVVAHFEERLAVGHRGGEDRCAAGVVGLLAYRAGPVRPQSDVCATRVDEAEECGRRVEAGGAEPVDGRIGRDEGCGAASVADGTVRLEGQSGGRTTRHAVMLTISTRRSVPRGAL